ncbi:up-regulator of cell proliferation-like [Aplochiton taeniatus]
MDQIPQHFVIAYSGPGAEEKMIHTEDCFINLSGLQPGTEYRLNVVTVLSEGEESESVTTFVYTRSCLLGLLSTAGLEDYYENKLTLSMALEVNSSTISDEPILNMHSLPRAFFKKLMIADVNARSVKCDVSHEDDLCYEVDSYDTTAEQQLENRNYINPLDLITAMFLCSDGFLQQEMVLKMSMCQFAVPLLLPNCETKEITMMLWAMREIVKKFTPATATGSCVEERIVCHGIPLVSFVRQGKSSLSKSQVLNKMLSNPQQYHDTFVHRDMDCGDAPRSISDGLVEISWYLPCGNKNTDIFTQPVVVANLRGDIETFDKQFTFLSQTSAAVYIFSDEMSALQGKNIKGELYLVTDVAWKTSGHKDKHRFSFRYPKNVIVKRHNEADFVKTLRLSVSKTIENNPCTKNMENMENNPCTKNMENMENNTCTKNMENMADIARLCDIGIDEDGKDCQGARKAAFRITSNITDTAKFKEEQLPFQKRIWKEIAFSEKHRVNEEELSRRQQHFKMTVASEQFLGAVSVSDVERTYFLKWMRINLDNLSRQNLSELRDLYKELKIANSPKELIANLDGKISDCSLGLEHFLREVGQLYESACSLPKHSPERQQMEHLPKLCAQMMLGGFPIELVDGDASNIPMKWISAVLNELHIAVQSKSKIRVITVLGVQGTGKSTLLNTMFGVQFAVSSGRCTRGAFMLLLKVNKVLKEKLKCDLIMVIDTEGLKAPELEQLDNSPERDNELATLVVGLSDITIVNMTMENSTEMTDILQVVIHTFLGMKGSLKKPICHFVHQNALHLSADANIRDRNKLLERLNGKTLAAAKMEKKENITKFTDVMEYDDTNNWYMPGLWHGTPPMAPVNAGYSVAVYDFKKRLMQDLNKLKKGDTLIDFLKLTKSLWESVNSFSFRNSICTVFNSWEVEFNRKISMWTEKAENQISEFGRTDKCSMKDLPNLLTKLVRESNEILELEKNCILDNIVNFFEKQGSSKHPIGKFREEFATRAETLRQDTADKVQQSLHEAVRIKEEMAELDNIKSSEGLKEMEQLLSKEYDKGRDVRERIKRLPLKPVDEMFAKIFGSQRLEK